MQFIPLSALVVKPYHISDDQKSTDKTQKIEVKTPIFSEKTGIYPYFQGTEGTRYIPSVFSLYIYIYSNNT